MTTAARTLNPHTVTDCWDGDRHTCRCTGGTPDVIAALPAIAGLRPILAAWLTTHTGADAAWLALHAPAHEESDTAASYALEGAYEWPYAAVNDPTIRAYADAHSLGLEVGTGWRLDVYPQGSAA